MDQTFTDAAVATAVPVPQSARPASRAALGLCTLLFVALSAWLALYQLNPPAPVPETAPPTEFSSARAMKYLENIASTPHPIGSARHAAVRDYLVKELTALGLQPEVQKTTVISQRRGSPFAAATVQNIVTRLKGTGDGKAVMLVGHYDSTPLSPGANDDGAAVASILETARALKSGAPLKNDLILLFTDGEEVGLLGAKAFMDEHPWAKDVGVVFNFEARGNGGPVLMFETSNRNGRLIQEFAKAASHPIASSLSYGIYKDMPNDTDMSIFKEAGLPGLNFAYLRGVTRYHSQLDNLTQVDQRTLQQDGSYALALARHFGNLQLDNLQSGNSIYFDVLGLWLVHYPASMVLPLAFVAALLFAGVVFLGWRRKRLTLKGMALGGVAMLLDSVLALLLVTLVWKLHRIIQNAFGLAPQADVYGSGLYLISFIALTIALVSTSYLLLRKVSTTDLTAGALFTWLALLFVSAVMMPSASYLLVWPLLFSLLALAYCFRAKSDEQRSWNYLCVVAVGALPAILLIVPIIYLIFTALTLNSYLLISVLVVLLSGLLIPHFRLLSATKRWLVPGLSALIGIGVMVAGGWVTRFDAARPQQDHLFYSLNTEAGSAIWGSLDTKPDQWSAQFLAQDARRGAISDYIPSMYNGFISSAAPAAELSAPEITLLDDQMKENGVRTIRLRIKSARQAPILTVAMVSTTDVLQASINGKRDETGTAPPRAEGRRWGLNYYSAPPEGIELALDVLASEPIKIRVQDESYGLPELPGQAFKPRPNGLIAAPLPYSDSTIVGKTYLLGTQPSDTLASRSCCRTAQ